MFQLLRILIVFLPSKKEEVPVEKEWNAVTRIIIQLLQDKKHPSTEGDQIVERFNPIPDLAYDICKLIWYNFNKHDLSKVSRVSKTWRQFSLHYLYLQMGLECEKRIWQKKKNIKYKVACSSKVRNFSVQFKVVKVSNMEEMKDLKLDMEITDGIVFLFQKICRKSYEQMDVFKEYFYKLKDYSPQFPTFIFITSEQERNKIMKYKNSTTGSSELKIVNEVNNLCSELIQDIYIEKKREKGIKESFRHKLKRKKVLLRECFLAFCISLAIFIVVTIPGFLIINNNDFVSLLFGIIFLSFGGCEILVGIYLFGYFCVSWYQEDKKSVPRYKRTSFCWYEYDGC